MVSSWNRIASAILVVTVIVITSSCLVVAQGHSQTTFTAEQQDLLEKLKIAGREAGLSKSVWNAIDKFDKDVCYDEECLESALEILSAANFREDPCDNNKWLDFVCKRRLQQHDTMDAMGKLVRATNLQTLALLENKNEKHSADYLFLEAKTYYDQCISKSDRDSEDVDFILKHTEKDGGWPMFTHEPPTPPASFNWLQMVADQNRFERAGFEPLFFKVELVGEELSGTPAIALNISMLAFPFTTPIVNDFAAMVVNMQKEAESEKYAQNPVNVSQLVTTMVELVKFQYDLREAMPLIGFEVEELTLSELQERSDNKTKSAGVRRVDWKAFFDRIFVAGSGGGGDVKIGETIDRILIPLNPVMEIIIFLEEGLAFSDDNKVTIANALHMNMAAMLLLESTSLLDNLSTFRCTEESGSRESICLQRVQEIFGYSLGATYLTEHYDDKVATPEVVKLMDNIKKGYVKLVEEELPWMSPSTKDYLIDKVRSIGVQVAKPDWMRTEDGLQSYYKGLNNASKTPSSSNGLYVSNFMDVNSWMVAKKRSHALKLARMTSTANLDIYDVEWHHWLGTVNAAYFSPTNQIQVDAGLIQSPMFDVRRPGFMNYGGLAMVLGHEIGHSFDTNGRKYDKTGDDSVEHWDELSLQKYEKWVEDLKTEYKNVPYNISDKLVNKMLNPDQTINEDIADVLGVYISFDAYNSYLADLKVGGRAEKVLPGLKEISPQKLFYMQYANMWCEMPDVQARFDQLTDVHSASSRRATLPLMISKEFKKTFGCQVKE